METKSSNVTPRNPRTERVYVKVTSEFESTGYMRPLSITWKDGRKFIVQKIENFCPAGLAGNYQTVDRYTVWIQGQKKFLFFEPVDPRFKGRLGRWFVEKYTRL